MANRELSAAIRQAIAHYPFSDSALFADAYRRLADTDAPSPVYVEVCCGSGHLAAWLAQTVPNATVFGIDYWDVHIDDARKKYRHLKNLHFRSGDALDLHDHPDESVDWVVGQATMHHLANNLPGAAHQFARVLKPGGQCAFIFEPLGHNPLIGAIRGVLNSRRQWIDESVLYEHALASFAEDFSDYQIDYYNLLGYVAKLLPQNEALKMIPQVLGACDRTLFQRWPAVRKHAANFNVFYRK